MNGLVFFRIYITLLLEAKKAQQFFYLFFNHKYNFKDSVMPLPIGL